MALSDSRLRAAQQAIDSIGLGFDLTKDISFNNCKWGSSLIVINEEQSHNLEIPGGVSIPNVPISIKCVRDECLRIHSDVLSLKQMSGHFNQELCLRGHLKSGYFCASFGISDRCIKDFDCIKSLAYDGWFLKRYTIELDKHQGELDDRVKEAVPLSWDPDALARFIEEFGAHVVVGVSMGGKDVLYLRQSHSSNLQPADLQKHLVDKADMRFMGSADNCCLTSEDVDVGNRPVVGLRLSLAGRRSNRLAIHLQHLACLPQSFPLSDNENAYLSCNPYNCTSHQKLRWNSYVYVCTAPLESDDALSIVTGAQLQVENKCLFLRLRFSKVLGSTLQNKPEWEPNPGNLGHKSRGFCRLCTRETLMSRPSPGQATISSVVHPTLTPVPAHPPKLLRFVDTMEITRGPEYSPGYWVVSGARLFVQCGRIYLMVKYSLLSLVMQSSETEAL